MAISAECEASVSSRYEHKHVIECVRRVCKLVSKKDGICVRKTGRGGYRMLESRLAEREGQAGDGDTV